METIPLLHDIVILMAVSVPITVILAKLGLPTVIGFLLTGVIIGPHGAGLIAEPGNVETLSQIGIVLLLFTIGLEFSITRLLGIKKEGLLGGGLQVGLTVLASVAVGPALGLDLRTALLIGFIVALSSTAIVLKLLTDSGEVNSPQGNLSLAILIFQDLCVVLMVMVVQSVGGGEHNAFEIAKGLVISLAAFVVIVIAVVYLIPRLFTRIVALRNREVFILTIVLVCLGTAWVTSLLGLSLALGAFVAGLAISESEYSNQIVAEVLPFRDTFSSLFFISIGMLLDTGFFIENIPWLALIVAGIVLIKCASLIGVGQALRYPIRLSLVVGLNLAQIGEFSFILIKMGRDYSLLNDRLYQSLLAATIVTMALTPFFYKGSARFAHDIALAIGKKASKRGVRKPSYSNHVVIVGYGLNGRNLAKVLKETGIPHLVIDMNMDRVKKARTFGHPSYFGDAGHPDILKNMDIERAKMLVLAISDPISSRRIVATAREINPALSIIVRTRYTKEVEDLYKLGATQVIPEEFETSVEIFSRVLKDYRIPGNIIQNMIDLIRNEGYAMFRNPSLTAERLSKISAVLEKSVTDTFYVEEGSLAAGVTLSELELRKRTGATIIAVVRGGQARTNPTADFKMEAGDILVIFGSHAELNGATNLLKQRYS